MATIPKGFSLTITSSENDGDSYTDVILYGLKPEDVKFYLYLLEFFTRPLNGNNEYDPGLEFELLKEAFSKYPPESEALQSKIQTILVGEPQDGNYFVSDLLGGNWPEDEFWRVFEGFKVHYIPENCLDITVCFTKDNR